MTLMAITTKQIEEAREQATDLRDRVTETGEKLIREPAEEVACLTDAVAWLAAEVRCQRLEDCVEKGT